MEKKKVFVVSYASYCGDELYNEVLGVYDNYDAAYAGCVHAIREDDENEETKDLGNDTWEYSNGWDGEYRRYRIEEKNIIIK